MEDGLRCEQLRYIARTFLPFQKLLIQDVNLSLRFEKEQRYFQSTIAVVNNKFFKKEKIKRTVAIIFYK
jgi:hypothetical protein